MECRNFEITLMSAIGLEDVRLLGKMEVQARVSVSGGGGPEVEKRTPTDTHGKMNPAWNFTTRFTVGESAIENYNTILVVKLYCTSKLGDRYIGEVNTPMKELFDVSRATTGRAIMCYPVKKKNVNSKGVQVTCYPVKKRSVNSKAVQVTCFPVKKRSENSKGGQVTYYPVKKRSVNSKGVLNFSYNFGEKVMIDKLLLAQTITPGGAVADLLRTAGGTPPLPPPR